MIKCGMNGKISISGSLPQIVVELEDILRGTRVAFCDALGEKGGNWLLEECIKKSKLSVEECVEEELERKRNEDPEAAALIEASIDELINAIFRKNKE